MSLVRTSNVLTNSAITTGAIVGTALTKQFKGFNIRVRPADGYIHATDMCKVGKKRWVKYIENKRTKEFIKELETSVRIRTNPLIQSITTGLNESRGTWVHPHIAINLAQWVSPMFAVKVSGWVARFISGDLTMAAEVIDNHDSANDTHTNIESAVNPETGNA